MVADSEAVGSVEASEERDTAASLAGAADATGVREDDIAITHGITGTTTRLTTMLATRPTLIHGIAITIHGRTAVRRSTIDYQRGLSTPIK